MPNPRFQSFAPALACAPLRRVRYRRLPKPSPVPSPGSDEGRGRPSSPSVGSNPARTPGPSPPGGRSESRSVPGTIAFAVRRSGQARSAFRQERVEIEGEPCNPRRTLFASLASKRTPILPLAGPSTGSELPGLDPFAASDRSELRSNRCRTWHEKRTPRRRSFAARFGSKLPSLAAGPSAEARTLRNRARRQHRREANPLSLPPGQPPGASPEPRPFAASGRSKLRPRPPDRLGTEIPARPASRAFRIEPKLEPSNRRT